MISWLVDTLLGVTLLMLLVLAVRRPVARFFGAGWAYALWLLPPLRLLLPPLPRIGPDIALPPAADFIPALGGVTASLPVEAGPGQWVPFMLALWAGGAVTFLLWHWLTYRAFLKALKQGARSGDPPSWGGIATLSSEAVEGPLAIGVLERWIVLPPFFSRRYSEGERRLAMEHELVHHRRGDIWWNMAGLVVLAANWFNPVAWFAFHAFRSDQELACDAAVAKRASRDERHDYARAMVKSASRPGLIAACPLNRADELKRRLRMIRSHREGKARSAGGLAAFAALLAGGLVVSNPVQPIEAGSGIAAIAGTVGIPGIAVAAPVAAPADPQPAVLAGASAPVPHRAALRAAAPAFALAPKVTARIKHGIGGLAFETLAPAAPAAAEVRYAYAAAPDPATFFRAARIRSPRSGRTPGMAAPAADAPPHAVPAVQVKVKPRRSRDLLIKVEDGTLLRVAGGVDTQRLTAVQAAIQRALAETNDAETRARLGRAVVAIETKLVELGVITTIN